MHKDFADWYRAVELEPQEAALQKRWATINRLIDSIDRGRGLDLVRVLAGLKPSATDFISWFSEAFKTEDQTFPMKNNAAELQVLAGALCVAGLDSQAQSVQLSDMIALAMVASTPKAKLTKFELRDVLSIALEYLRDRSQDNRPAMRTNHADELRGVIEALKTACTGNNTLGHMETQLADFSNSVGDRLEALAEANDVLKEETNILWWLLGGFSEDLEKPFTSIDAGCMALVAPKELSDRVLLLPGPASARALLSAAITRSIGDKEVSLADAIEKTPKAWRQARFTNGQDPVLDLCPVLSIIKKSLEGTKSQWQAQAAKGSRIPLKEKLARLDIAHQLYTEHLLVRALKNINA